MNGLSLAFALLSAQSITGVNALIPSEMASTLSDAQQAIEEAGTCMSDRTGSEVRQFDAIYQRSAELQARVRSLWGRQTVIETEVAPRIDCKNIPAKLALAEKRLDALAKSFAAHSAPFDTGVWIGTMPLCGAGPIEARKTVDEYSGANVLIITFDKAAAADLAALTAANVGNPLAIRVDGKVIMEPYVNEPIIGGSIQVQGPSRDELVQLAALLKRCTAEAAQNSRVSP